MPPVELLLMLLLIATVIVVARLKDLFAAAMLTGIASLLAAGLFVLMDAVDVAFTEAAVGAGVSTVLFLGALSLTSRREKQQERTRILPILIVVATGAALIYGTWDMPAYGDPDAVIHHHLAPELIAETENKIHIPNIVTAILASFRGYDTFGEVVVIFTAGVGVALLLGGLGLRRRDERGEEES